MKKEQIADLQKAARLLEEAQNLISGVRENLQEYYDDRSEAWQESERGEEFQERIDSVANVYDEVETAFDYLTDIIEEN